VHALFSSVSIKNLKYGSDTGMHALYLCPIKKKYGWGVVIKIPLSKISIRIYNIEQ